MTAARRSLQGANVLVAGGSGGIGRLVVERLAIRGASVVELSRRDQPLPHAGERVVGDIADVAVCERAVAAVLAKGRLDGVVNVAGVVAFGEVLDLDDEVLSELFRTNVFGPLRLVRSALPHLDGGFIANVTGAVVDTPTAGLAAYGATKSALAGATAALRREVRRRRIDVIDLRPPHTESGLVYRALAGEAPRLRPGLSPDTVARRIIDAIEARESLVEPDEFLPAMAA